MAIKKVMLDRRYHNRELQMMKVMDHENVVKLRHYFEKQGRKKDEIYLHLVMDFLPETIRSVALQHHKRRKRFAVDHIRAYLWQTFRALEYIHARRICHRDIKPDNLLCDPTTLKCRLCDFGCSKVLVKGQPNVSYICSRYYRAPELMFGATEYAVGVDIWSVGTILMELLLGHLPYQGQDSTQQHLVEIMKLLGTPSDKELRAMRATCSVEELPKLKAYPWDRVFPGIPENTPTAMQNVPVNYTIRNCQLEARTQHNPLSCLMQDDIEGISVLYPDCGEYPINGEGICHNVNMNIGLVRIAVYILLPSIISLLFVVACSTVIHAFERREKERLAASAAKHKENAKKEGVLGKMRVAAAKAAHHHSRRQRGRTPSTAHKAQESALPAGYPQADGV